MSIVRNWDNAKGITSRSYKCGYCGNHIASNVGYYGKNPHNGHDLEFIYICHKCQKPTYFSREGRQTPGASIGSQIQYLNDHSVKSLFFEAQSCYSVGAYTSCVMACRKLLMNIAVSEGAKEGLNYVKYVNFLSDENHIPPRGKEWVDAIRTMGNQANHEISEKSESEAKLILTFVEMLLKFIYEISGLLEQGSSNSQEHQQGD